MKRMVAWILALLMVFSLCACGASDNGYEASDNGAANNLTMEELKSIIAVKYVVEYLEDTLSDPESLSILGITVVKEPDMNYHIVRIDYNADNETGGKDRNEFYIETNNGGLGDNTEYFGTEAEQVIRRGNNAAKYDAYINDGMEEVEVDVDTVMAHLNLTEDELRDMVWEITGESNTGEEIFLD